MKKDLSPEQLLHDALIVISESNLKAIEDSWRDQGKVQPFMISWPQEPVEADDGTIITDVVEMELPLEPQERKREIRRLVKRTKPCALLMCEDLEDAIKVIFESPLGTKSWTYPIQKCGRDRVLGSRSVRENTDAIGVLWKAN